MARLLFGCESRTFSKYEPKEHQAFVNKCTLGLLRQRRIAMSSDRKTMQDLRKALNLDAIEIYIDWRCLQFLGHQFDYQKKG
eukprot:2673338-Pyramimonas_sp.AAC.1